MKRYRPTFRLDLAMRHIAGFPVQSNADAGLLPSARALARSAHVSRHTMLKALHRACDQGLVQRLGTRGFIMRQKPLPMNRPVSDPNDKQHRTMADVTATIVAPADHSLPRHRQIEEHLRQAVLRGDFPSGAPLPTARQLCARFGATHATVRNALRSLAARSLLSRQGRGYKAFLRIPNSRNSILALIAPTAYITSLITMTPWSMEFCQTLMQECNRLGLTLEMYGIDEALGTGLDPHARIRNLLELTEKKPVVGFVAYTVDTATDEWLVRLIDLLARSGRPSALFDDRGALSETLFGMRHRRIKVFSKSGAPACGLQMGRFLISLGHRRVAYVNEKTPDPIFDGRRTGLERAFDEAGLGRGVETFASESGQTGDPEGILSRKYKPLLRVMRAFQSTGKTLPTHANLNEIYLRSHDFMAENALAHIRNLIETADRLRPVFDRLSRRNDRTAWVASSDRVALLGLAEALDRDIRIPAHLSIAGFDDWLTSVSNGITSYNFNVATAVRRMMDFIVSPSRRANLDDPAVVETEGFIVERRTTGVARKKTGNVLQKIPKH